MNGPNFPSETLAPLDATVPSPLALSRVGEVLQAIAAARAPSDAELRQHALDCAHLMEAAYARFEAFHVPSDRDEALLWMHRRDDAMRALSPAWKTRREAEIQAAIAEGCYFARQGELARIRLAGGRR